jgi:hypothetical protein
MSMMISRRPKENNEIWWTNDEHVVVMII